MLKLRILTAAVLIPLVILGILFFTLFQFLIATLCLILLGAWEWSALIKMTSMMARLAYLVLIFIVFVLGYALPLDSILLPILLLWVAAGFWISCYPKGHDLWHRFRWVQALVGVLVLVPCALALNGIRAHGVVYVFLLLILVCGADTGAYFAGRFWGRRKLAPRVSPGKTLEGLYGGLVVSMLLAGGFAYLAHLKVTFIPWFLLVALFTVLLSVLGDLFESLVKREADVKDSGKLLPGHGGVLDRIDSLTAAAPALAMGLWLVR